MSPTIRGATNWVPAKSITQTSSERSLTLDTLDTLDTLAWNTFRPAMQMPAYAQCMNSVSSLSHLAAASAPARCTIVDRLLEICPGRVAVGPEGLEIARLSHNVLFEVHYGNSLVPMGVITTNSPFTCLRLTMSRIMTDFCKN